MKTKIQTIMRESKSNKHEYNIRQYPDVYRWILSNTDFLPNNVKFLERLYCVLNDYKPICEHQEFTQNLKKGYAFCGRPTKCLCAKENHSKKISEAKQEMTQIEIITANEKRKETCLKKYGVEYNSQSNVIKEKKEQTCLKHYGVTTNLLTTETKNKIKETKLERYGDKNYNNQKKRGITNLERYGNICSAQSNNTKDLIFKRHNIKSASQNRYSELQRSILFNKEIFIAYVTEKTIPTIAYFLEIDKNTVTRYIKKYKCEAKLSKYIPSKYEEIIKEYLNELGVNYIQNSKKIISPLELDFYLPDYKLAIEINGNYWHSEIGGNKDKNYHYNKWKLCKEQNIDLYSYFEDELINSMHIIKSKILYLINKNKVITGARKCQIKNITYKEERLFLNNYHIQGESKARTKTIGAYYNNELVAIFSWSLKKKYLEITRFACDNKASYPGLFSKMMKHMIKELNYKGEIVSFSNNGHSNGGVYKASGFINVKILGPSYWYMKDYLIRENRQGYMKIKIAKQFEIDMSDKTEWNAMKELGYDRIWDSGKIKWSKTI